MNTVCSFFAKFASLLVWSLSCFDRVIFKGHLPISYPAKFEAFVDCVLKMRRADFLQTTARQWSERLVEHAQALARQYGCGYQYRQGKIDKDAWAKEQLQQQASTSGLIGVLCVQETCPTFKLARGQDRPRLVLRSVPQRVLYFYFYDRDLGLLHVRLQTWAPFTCQIYVNGHDYLMQRLRQRGLGFEKIDNAFVALDDPQQAQRLANRFAKLPWPKILEKYARQVNPLLHHELKGMSHYWVTDQAEYATDILFTSKHALAALFGRLLEFAVLTFSPKKIFQYLGRKLHTHFAGEVQSHYRSERVPGACVKHYLKNNWLKRYDKLGLLLRVETVINQPGEFKVYRECQHRDGSSSKGWYALCKGVGNLHHYQSHALACNRRYLEALAAVDDPTPSYDDLQILTEPKRERGRSYAGFNPARAEEARLFAAVLAGDHAAQGFHNKDIRQALYGTTKDRGRRHRQSAAVGRLLKRLHVRGLVKKVPHSRRWRVSARGRRILSEALRSYRRYGTEAA